MKTIAQLGVLLLVALVSCQSVSAQPSPAISTKYSDAEIDKMIDVFHFARSMDVRPTAELANQFQRDFPNAWDVDWEMGGEVYEVEFEIGREDYKAYYDAQANLLMYRLDLNGRNVPAVVLNAAVSKYQNYRMDDAKKVVKGTRTYYLLEMEDNRRDIEVNAKFTHDGKFIEERFH